jgi:hypothetical protein
MEKTMTTFDGTVVYWMGLLRFSDNPVIPSKQPIVGMIYSTKLYKIYQLGK